MRRQWLRCGAFLILLWSAIRFLGPCWTPTADELGQSTPPRMKTGKRQCLGGFVNLPPFSIARSRQDATVKKRLRSCAIPCAFHVHTTALLIAAKSVSLRSSNELWISLVPPA